MCFVIVVKIMRIVRKRAAAMNREKERERETERKNTNASKTFAQLIFCSLDDCLIFNSCIVEHNEKS